VKRFLFRDPEADLASLMSTLSRQFFFEKLNFCFPDKIIFSRIISYQATGLIWPSLCHFSFSQKNHLHLKLQTVSRPNTMRTRFASLWQLWIL